MGEFNFVNDPVNPNYVIVVKINAVDEAYANVKKSMIDKKLNQQEYFKLSGEVIYLWEHLRPILRENRVKIIKKVDEEYNVDLIVKNLDSDKQLTYQELKQSVRLFHDICYYCNITKPKAYFKTDPSKENMLNS